MAPLLLLAKYDYRRRERYRSADIVSNKGWVGFWAFVCRRPKESATRRKTTTTTTLLNVSPLYPPLLLNNCCRVLFLAAPQTFVESGNLSSASSTFRINFNLPPRPRDKSRIIIPRTMHCWLQLNSSFAFLFVLGGWIKFDNYFKVSVNNPQVLRKTMERQKSWIELVVTGC